MEPAQAPIRYRINTRVAGLKFDAGKWFVLFEGSWEWLGLGPEEPEFKVGAPASIIIESQ